ncbi:uncharacterized protein LOC144325850 [Podarcis muralis]
MAWALFLLILFSHCTGGLAQFVLTQPLLLSASPGETINISCTRSSGNIASYAVSWYQQKPGSSPKPLIFGFSSRTSGIPERFSGSFDESSNSATLTIANLQAEDEAVYYCLSYDTTEQPTMFAIQPYTGVGEELPENGFCSSAQQLQPLKSLETVPQGGSITLSCRHSSGTITDGLYPQWFQQKGGQVPRLILYQTSTRPSGIPARFSGSKSGNTMSLTITGAQAEDEATYYCCVLHPGVSCTAGHSDGEVRQKPF